MSFAWKRTGNLCALQFVSNLLNAGNPAFCSHHADMIMDKYRFYSVHAVFNSRKGYCSREQWRTLHNCLPMTKTWWRQMFETSVTAIRMALLFFLSTLSSWKVFLSPRGTGGTPLYLLYGDVPLDRVWFFRDPCLKQSIQFACLCLEQGIYSLDFRASPLE